MAKGNGMLLKKLVDEVGFQIVNRASDYETKTITTEVVNRPGLQLTGFYEHFDSDRIQIIGIIEMTYLRGFNTQIRRKKFDELFDSGIPVLIIAHEVEILPECLESAKEHDTTLLKSKRETSDLIVAMITRLKDGLAPRITRHGVLVEVHGEGMLILGDSGIGKSETAVELIKRGHRLVADDAVNIKKVNATTLIGSAPELIRYYIELRGVGVVDVRQIFGSGSVKLGEKIDIVVNLETWKDGASYDRIGAEMHYTEILGVKVPCITVPITPGRNLAVILEVAAMNNRQKRLGYNAAKNFSERIDQYFDSMQGSD